MEVLFQHFVIIINILIIIYAGDSTEIPSMTNSAEIASPEFVGNETINQNDDIFIRPMPSNNNFINFIPNSNFQVPKKKFELVVSKRWGPFGNLFLSVNKWQNDNSQSQQHLPPRPEFIFQSDHMPQQDQSTNVHFQQDYQQQVNLIQQELLQPQQHQTFQPLPQPPNQIIKPFVFSIPGVLVSGYKTLVDKIWSKNAQWDASINLPFVTIRKAGQLGIDVHGLGTHTHHNDGHDQFHNLIDIRDPVVEGRNIH